MIMPGLANTGINNLSLRVSHGLQVSYSGGDRWRTPVSMRYQYRMKRGNILGTDFTVIYNPLIITPQYLDANSVFGGPSISAGHYMRGLNVHYSKTIDIKILEVFGMAGFGAYYNGKQNNPGTSDFSWYKDANPEFYNFAPVVSDKALRKLMPVIVFGCGVRFRHLEGGINHQIALSGPVKDFTYNGYTHSVPLNWKSIGYYVGYRFEF